MSGFTSDGGGGWGDEEEQKPEPAPDYGYVADEWGGTDPGQAAPAEPDYSDYVPAADAGTLAAYAPDYGNADYGLNAGYDQAGYAAPAEPEPRYVAPDPRPDYSDVVDEWGGTDPGQAAYAPPPAPDYGGVIDEWAGSDPGQAAYVAPTWQDAPVDQWGGADPYVGNIHREGDGIGLVESQAYNTMLWDDPHAMVDNEVDGNNPFEGVARSWTDSNGDLYQWDPSARGPSQDALDYLTGNYNLNTWDREAYAKGREEAQGIFEAPQEYRNWLYTQGAQRAASQSYDFETAAARQQRDFIAFQGEQRRAQELRDQQIGFDQHLAEQNAVIDARPDYGDPTLWEGPNGRERNDRAGNQGRAGAEFDRYVGLIRQGSGFEAASQGLTDAEKLNLWAAGQAWDDPAKLAAAKQQWIDAHVYDPGGTNRSYMADPNGWMSASQQDVGDAAAGAIVQGGNALMNLPAPLIQKADHAMAQLPGVTGVSNTFYTFVQQALAIPPEELKTVEGPLGAGFGALGDTAHEAVIQVAGIRLYEQEQRDRGVPGTQIGAEDVQARRARGEAWAQAHPTEAWFLEQAAGAALTFGMGKFVPKTLAGEAATAVGNRAFRIDTAGDWTTGRTPVQSPPGSATTGVRNARDLPAVGGDPGPRGGGVVPGAPAGVAGGAVPALRAGEHGADLGAPGAGRGPGLGADPAAVPGLDPAFAQEIRDRVSGGFQGARQVDEASSYPNGRSVDPGPSGEASGGLPREADGGEPSPRRALPEIPGTQSGADYLEQFRNGQAKPPVPHDETYWRDEHFDGGEGHHSFDDGEPMVDLEGEQMPPDLWTPDGTDELLAKGYYPEGPPPSRAQQLRGRTNAIPEGQREARITAKDPYAEAIPQGRRYDGPSTSGADIADQHVVLGNEMVGRRRGAEYVDNTNPARSKVGAPKGEKELPGDPRPAGYRLLPEHDPYRPGSYEAKSSSLYAPRPKPPIQDARSHLTRNAMNRQARDAERERLAYNHEDILPPEDDPFWSWVDGQKEATAELLGKDATRRYRHGDMTGEAFNRQYPLAGDAREFLRGRARTKQNPEMAARSADDFAELSPVNKGPEIEAAYENLRAKLRDIHPDAPRIQQRLDELARFGPPEIGPDGKQTFPLIGGRIKFAQDDLAALVKQGASQEQIRAAKGALVRLQMEREALYKEIPKGQRKAFDALQQQLETLQWAYDHQTDAGHIESGASKWDTLPEVDAGFHADGDSLDAHLGADGLRAEPTPLDDYGRQQAKQRQVDAAKYGRLEATGRTSLGTGKSGRTYEMPEMRRVGGTEPARTTPPKGYNWLEGQRERGAAEGPAAPLTADQEAVLRDLVDQGLIAPEAVAKFQDTRTAADNPLNNEPRPPSATGQRTPAALDQSAQAIKPSYTSAVERLREEAGPREPGVKAGQPYDPKIAPAVGEGAQNARVRELVQRTVAEANLRESPLFRSAQATNKTLGELLVAVRKNTTPQMKAQAVMGSLPMLNVTTIDEDDTAGQRLLKYGAAIVGGTAVGYGILRHPKLLGRRVGPGMKDLPDLSWSDRRVKLPKDTQRLRVATASKGYLQTHLQPAWDQYRTGKLDLGGFNQKVHDLIDTGGAGKAATYKQTVLDQQMKNLWALNGLGDKLKQETSSAINGANGTFAGVIDNLAGKIDELLADDSRIGRTFRLDDKGKTAWTPKSFVHKSTDVLRKPFHEIFLQHNPGWLAEQVVDGYIQRSMAGTLDQIGLEFRRGAAGQTLDLMGEADSGWPGSSYIDNTRFSDIPHADEPTIFGRDKMATNIRAAAERVETDSKRIIYSREASGYLNTAMARELGTQRAAALKWLDPNNDPFLGTEKGRLASLPEHVKSWLDGTVDRRDVLSRVEDFHSRGDITAQQARDIVDIFDSHQADAHRYALAETRSRMRDYAQKTNLDMALQPIAPLHYWTTHNIAFMARMAAKHPTAAFAVMAAAAWTMDRNKDQPNYLKMSAKVPVRDLANLLPEAQKRAVNEAVDAAFGAGNDPRVNLWGYANPFVADVVKTIDKGDWKKLKAGFGSPETGKMLAELANGFGYHAGPMYDMLSTFVQAGDSWKWLDKLTEEPYQGRNFGGPFAKFAADLGELTPLQGLLHGVNHRLTGHDYSALDEQGIKDRGGDHDKYFQGKAIQDAAYLLGARNTVGKGDNVGSDQRAKEERQAKGPAPVTDQYPEPYQPDTPENKRKQAFIQEHPFPKTPDGKPYADGSPEMQAYWDQYGDEWRMKVQGQDNPDFGNRLGTKALVGGADVLGHLEDKAIKGTQKGPDGQELPGQYGTTQIAQQLQDALYQANKGKPSNKQTSQEKTATGYVWDWYNNQPLSPGGPTPAEYQKRWAGGAAGENPAGEDGRYKIAPPTLGAGMATGAKGDGSVVNDGVNYQKGVVSKGYYDLKTPDGKSTPASRAYYDTPLYPGGPTPTEFFARWDNDNPNQGDGTLKGDAPAEFWGVGRGDPGTTVVTKGTGLYPGTRAGGAAAPPPTGGSTAAKPAASSGTKPTTGVAPSQSSGARTTAATAKPTTASAPRTTTAPKASVPATTRNYAPGAPKTPATTPRTTATSSRASTGTTAAAKPSAWDYEHWARDWQAATPRAQAPTPAAAPEGGYSAKEIASRYNDWQGRVDGGKADGDLAEPLQILADHVASGGDPAPYVRRMKYNIYSEIRAYKGPTRQAGDKQRGQWMAAVKALPDDLKGARQLAAIQKQVRGNGQVAQKPKAA